jgi:hypothetical protein
MAMVLTTGVKQLDRLLRGDAIHPSALRFGTVVVPVKQLSLVILILGLLYGLCMASFAMVNGADAIMQRIVATMLKVPTLFFLTLAITFPSLYIFNALVGSRLSADSVMQLLISALGVMMAVLASMGPIVAFFSLSTTSYSFMLLLNVAVFATAGILGLRFLFLTLQRISLVRNGSSIDDDDRLLQQEFERLAEADPHHAMDILPELQVEKRRGALDRRKDDPTSPKVRTIFRIWVVVFGLVGAQLSWVMRPFIGGVPGDGFTWFSPRESSFFEAVWHAFTTLLS